jgi:hypothetical protein
MVGSPDPDRLRQFVNEISRKEAAYRRGAPTIELGRFIAKKRGHFGGIRHLWTQIDYEGQGGGGDDGVQRRYRLFTADQDYILTGFNGVRTTNLGATPAGDQHFLPVIARQGAIASWMDVTVCCENRQKNTYSRDLAMPVYEGDQIWAFVGILAEHEHIRNWWALEPIDYYQEAMIRFNNWNGDCPIATIPTVGHVGALVLFDSHRGGYRGPGTPAP